MFTKEFLFDTSDVPFAECHASSLCRTADGGWYVVWFAGTLALAFHTTGVLGRLFAESIENAPPEPADALRAQGTGNLMVFYFTTLPQVLPQLMSYTLYRWENNIRAAAVLGVVGAGGLGQLLSFHMGLFQMGKTATILAAMLLLVALVDSLSYHLRRKMTR